MPKRTFFESLQEQISISKVLDFIYIVLFILLFTSILIVKYFLFQNIIDENNISKKDIITTKEITVVDVYKTELRQKAAVQQVNPVLMLSESSYIRNDLKNIFSNIDRVLQKKVPTAIKEAELLNLFDFVAPSQKKGLTFQLVKLTPTEIEKLYNLASDDLNAILLKINIAESNFDNTTVMSYINRYYSLTEPGRKYADTKIILPIIEQTILSNLIINEKATEIAKENAMASVIPYTKTFQKGDKILYEGQQVNKFERAVLKEAGYKVLDINFKGILGILTIVTTAVIGFLYYLYYFEKNYLSRNNLMIIAVLTLLMATITALKPDNVSFYVIPMPLYIMLIGLLLKPRIAFVSSLILLSIFSLAFLVPSHYIAIFYFISMFACIAIASMKSSKRVDLLKIGISLALIIMLLILAVYYLELSISNETLQSMLLDIAIATLVCIFSGIVALGTMPLFESLFKIITPYQLAELSEQNQPLLKRLQTDTPGTFTHSVMVANLAENAAEAIGADPILTRVGALYHDIGKLKRPYFFVENQSVFGIENPHIKKNLTPKVSKMIVTAHTKEGVELAKENNLPKVIQDIIAQHHGDSLVSYFYAEAVKQEGEENVDDSQFRYAGPKPQTKEAAIVMLADAVEAAARAVLDEYSQEALDSLIEKIFKDKLNDGQLSDSTLTLKDLKNIGTAFNRILRATHHQRIKYHDDILKQLDEKTEQNEI